MTRMDLGQAAKIGFSIRFNYWKGLCEADLIWKEPWNNCNILSRNMWTGHVLITGANEIASKASLSGGYKWPLIGDEPSVFIERDLRNIALINFLAQACLWLFLNVL